MKYIKHFTLSSLLLLATVSSVAVYAIDQCNNTKECRGIFGKSATDCKNSKASNSICFCGSKRCDIKSGIPSSVVKNKPKPIDKKPIDKPVAEIKPKSPTQSNPIDQCNNTRQCQAKYGNVATDCKNSRSVNSVCLCGSARCDVSKQTQPVKNQPKKKPPVKTNKPTTKPKTSVSEDKQNIPTNGKKVLLETGGLIAIEAENYDSIDNKGFRAQWKLVSNNRVPQIKPDPDGIHLNGSSNNQYLEILPDTRVTHADKIIKKGENSNIFKTAGVGPTIKYKVYFNNPGLYYVWMRAFSTGTEDNGAHVGINNSWPASGARIQWCKGKNNWAWSRGQRSLDKSDHCGQNRQITLNIPSKGVHTIAVSMREDGFELDKIILAKDKNFRPMGSSVKEKFHSVTKEKQQPKNTNGKKLGKFDTSKDILVACFDGKPDTDDIHSQAALATLLRDSRFSDVNHIVVVGCVGTQGGTFIKADKLANMAFGSANWTDANKNWRGSVSKVVNKVLPVLRSGGKVWVQEAGQSDFTADFVREIKSRDDSLQTKNIHVIQHSNWNERQTSKADLNYVKTNTSYKKIADGNTVGNGSAGYKDGSGANWNWVINNARVGDIWKEARTVANEWNGRRSGYNNPAIRGGGFDFSDCSENAYIFGFTGEASTVTDFFDEFL